MTKRIDDKTRTVKPPRGGRLTPKSNDCRGFIQDPTFTNDDSYVDSINLSCATSNTDTYFDDCDDYKSRSSSFSKPSRYKPPKISFSDSMSVSSISTVSEIASQFRKAMGCGDHHTRNSIGVPLADLCSVDNTDYGRSMSKRRNKSRDQVKVKKEKRGKPKKKKKVIRNVESDISQLDSSSRTVDTFDSNRLSSSSYYPDASTEKSKYNKKPYNAMVETKQHSIPPHHFDRLSTVSRYYGDVNRTENRNPYESTRPPLNHETRINSIDSSSIMRAGRFNKSYNGNYEDSSAHNNSLTYPPRNQPLLSTNSQTPIPLRPLDTSNNTWNSTSSYGLPPSQTVQSHSNYNRYNEKNNGGSYHARPSFRQVSDRAVVGRQESGGYAPQPKEWNQKRQLQQSKGGYSNGGPVVPPVGPRCMPMAPILGGRSQYTTSVNVAPGNNGVSCSYNHRANHGVEHQKRSETSGIEMYY